MFKGVAKIGSISQCNWLIMRKYFGGGGNTAQNVQEGSHPLNAHQTPLELVWG